MLSDNQCWSCKNTYGGMVGLQFFTQTFGGMVIIGLLVREWFTLKCFMGGMVLFFGGMASLASLLNSNTAANHSHKK